jgi:hypothetical protein
MSYTLDNFPTTKSWIKALSKEQAIAQCQSVGIPEEGQLEELRVNIRKFFYPEQTTGTENKIPAQQVAPASTITPELGMQAQKKNENEENKKIIQCTTIGIPEIRGS